MRQNASAAEPCVRCRFWPLSFDVGTGGGNRYPAATRGRNDMSKTLGITLWVVQGLLAALFLFAGGVKLVATAAQMQGPPDLPLWFLRFIGVCEVSGALGLVLPGIFRTRTGLTPLAAAGLVVIMIGATVLTATSMGVPMALTPLVVGILAAWIAYARWRALSGPVRGVRLTT